MKEPLAKDQDKFVVRLPDGMRERIADVADANSRSMNAEIIDRIEKSFSNAELALRLSELEAELEAERKLNAFRSAELAARRAELQAEYDRRRDLEVRLAKYEGGADANEVAALKADLRLAQVEIRRLSTIVSSQAQSIEWESRMDRARDKALAFYENSLKMIAEFALLNQGKPFSETFVEVLEKWRDHEGFSTPNEMKAIQDELAAGGGEDLDLLSSAKPKNRKPEE